MRERQRALGSCLGWETQSPTCSCLLRIRTPASPPPSVQSSSSDPHPPPASEDSRVRDGPGGGKAGAGRPAPKTVSRGAGSANRVFSVSISSCLVPSRRGHASSPQAGGLLWSSGARAPSVPAPAPRIAHGSVAWPLPPRLPTGCPWWFVLGKVLTLPACFEPPCTVSNLEFVVLACLVFFPADKYVGSEACHSVGF